MSSTSAFKGSVPQNYDRHLGNLFFEPYAIDLAERVKKLAPARVLETASGTGIVTRRLREALPSTSELIATDLNPGMMTYAQSKAEMPREIEWREADAQNLPFEDRSFDAVVCSFGMMFLPDKPKGFAEAFRVLKPGGTLFFTTWDGLDENWCSNAAHRFLQVQLPDSPPQFFLTPYGWNDVPAIIEMVENAGFLDVMSFSLNETSAAPTAESVATGTLMGTPVYGQLVEQGVDVEAYVAKFAREIRAQVGEEEIRVPMRAFVFEARKPTN